MKVSVVTLITVSLFVLVIVGLTVWRTTTGPGPKGSTIVAMPYDSSAGTTLDSNSAPRARAVNYPAGIGEEDASMPGTAISDLAAPLKPDPEPEADHAAQIRVADLPPPLLELVHAAYREFVRGNVEYAAMLAQEAVAVSDAHPAVKPRLYGMIGYAYERLDYIDMAVEYYRLALAIDPLQRISYDGMRRLDPEFAASHPKLHPAPVTQKAEKAQAIE